MRKMTAIKKRNDDINAQIFLVLVSRFNCDFSITTISLA
jgi:hypothetical protein